MRNRVGERQSHDNRRDPQENVAVVLVLLGVGRQEVVAVDVASKLKWG